MISNGAATRQAGIEEENIEVERVEVGIEAVRGDPAEEPGEEPGNARSQEEQEEEEEEEEGLPSYLQAVAGEEEATWLNLGYQP